GYAVSEMITSRRDLWASLKTSRRANHEGEVAPIAVQIAGTDAAMMAEAALYNIDRGAQIIDINMGCPAKKVCNKWAGSALMQDEPLALEIVDAVVAACALRRTGADAVMIGRAAQGRPWIFREVAHYLATGGDLPAPEVLQAKSWLLEHLHDHYGLYGEFAGVRTARKHIGWAVRALPGGEDFRAQMNLLESCDEQVRAVGDWFDALADAYKLLPANEPFIEQQA